MVLTPAKFNNNKYIKYIPKPLQDASSETCGYSLGIDLTNNEQQRVTT
ncbi:protein of unknown function [Moritella yayanosii]|uniref:Uncharacterized protein n=1 Tax=Moritella yayanosii TaxID=69539 RepID=A0A330LMY9_9GAMM|nr:protein of unknown function [Moritella yayanosii]